MSYTLQVSKYLACSPQSKQEEDNNKHTIYQQVKNKLSSLPCVDGCSSKPLYNLNGYFLTRTTYIATVAAQTLFRARPTDIFLVTVPKSGTTWLKALLFAMLHRDLLPYSDPNHPLLTCSPHQCIPFLEYDLYVENQIPDLDSLASPRLYATHIPFLLLPKSIIRSHCPIVYLCRNPKDTFVSMWHFYNQIRAKSGIKPLPLGVGFNRFCDGISAFGPYWDHVIDYWKASLQREYKVLFMRYEEWMEDPVSEVKRLAEFLGCPFSAGEEENGAAEGIVRLCRFENLSSLDVNKTGDQFGQVVDNSVYFRRGVVGDWTALLTTEMASKLDEIIDSEFVGSGLSFQKE